MKANRMRFSQTAKNLNTAARMKSAFFFLLFGVGALCTLNYFECTHLNEIGGRIECGAASPEREHLAQHVKRLVGIRMKNLHCI